MANHSPDADALRSRREKRMLDAAKGSNGPAIRGSSAPPEEENGWDEDEPRAKDELNSMGESEGKSDPSLVDSVESLKEENDHLRQIIGELRQMLEESAAKGGGGGGQSFDEREKEYEAMLEEKSEVIRTLHVRIQKLEKSATDAPPAPATPVQSDLLALSDELERERCQIEQERRQLEADRIQLRDDEEAMMRQMREMELQMAKERAELARQRNELQRLHSEIRHELEVAQRDAAVNERLKVLQRRHKEVVEGPSSPPSDAPKKQPPSSQAPKKEGGGSIIKRWFGGDK